MIEAQQPPQTIELQQAPDYSGQGLVKLQDQGDREPTEDELTAGFEMLIDNLQADDADSFAKEIQDFRDAFLVAGGYDNEIEIRLNTDKGVGITINISGKTEDVLKKIEDAIKTASGQTDIDLSNLTLEDLLDYQTIVTIPGVGTTTVHVKTVRITLRVKTQTVEDHTFEKTGKGSSASSDVMIPPTPGVEGTAGVNPTVIAAATPDATNQGIEIENRVKVSLDNPQTYKFALFDTFIVDGYDGAEFVVTSAGLSVKRPGNVMLSVRGNRSELTDSEDGAYSAIADRYFVTPSDKGLILTPKN